MAYGSTNGMSEPFAIDEFVTFETCVTAEDIVITCTNGGATLTGMPTGTDHSEPTMTRGQIREHRRNASRPADRGAHRRSR